MRHVALCFGHAFKIPRLSTWTLSRLGSIGVVTTLSAWRSPRFPLAPSRAPLRSEHFWSRPKRPRDRLCLFDLIEVFCQGPGLGPDR